MKLKQEMKDSKVWEYDPEAHESRGLMLQDFRSHKWNNVSVLFVEKDGNEHAELCFLLEESHFESGKSAEIYEDISIEQLNSIIKVFLESNKHE